MHASTHTFELDPAATWRLAGTRKSVALRPEPPAIARPIDVGAAEAPTITRRSAEGDPPCPQIGDLLELGCFVATLVGIWLLQLGVFALLV